MSGLSVFQGLTDRQAAFVRHASEGVPPDVAALRAGYPDSSYGYRLACHPAVATALHRAVQAMLVAEAPVSLRVLKEIRDDKDAPKGVRADIGVKLLRLAGHVEPQAGQGAPDKQLTDMTPEELLAYIDRNQAEIDRLEAELASRAKDVSAQGGAQTPRVIEAKPLQYLD